MRELDVMLEGWLGDHWSEASSEQRAAFRCLLDFEDDCLWSWLSGRELPEDEQLRCLVRHIAR